VPRGTAAYEGARQRTQQTCCRYATGMAPRCAKERRC
jgi:hypothetical protein